MNALIAPFNLYSAAHSEHKYTLSFIYAHGQAEDYMQHDVLLTTWKIEPPPGIYPVVLHNGHGDSRVAIMFVWPEQKATRGLVVFGDDIESVAYCCETFQQQSAIANTN